MAYDFSLRKMEILPHFKIKILSVFRKWDSRLFYMFTFFWKWDCILFRNWDSDFFSKLRSFFFSRVRSCFVLFFFESEIVLFQNWDSDFFQNWDSVLFWEWDSSFFSKGRFYFILKLSFGGFFRYCDSV